MKRFIFLLVTIICSLPLFGQQDITKRNVTVTDNFHVRSDTVPNMTEVNAAISTAESNNVEWTDTVSDVATHPMLDSLANSVYTELNNKLEDETDPVYATDSANTLKWNDTINDIATQYDLLLAAPDTVNDITTKYDVDTLARSLYDSLYAMNAVETASRTIYYSSTGSDETGDGTSGTPYASVLRACQDIKAWVIGVKITISGAGDADFPITSALQAELAKKTWINSELAFVGTEIVTVESGFTVAQTASRLYARTLTKTGLTATENQYRGMFVRLSSNYFPIAYNAAGTNSFEIEFTNTSSFAATSIIQWGVTWTNPNNTSGIFDLNLPGDNSVIRFDNMNLNSGTTAQNYFTGTTAKYFNQCAFLGRNYNFGDVAKNNYSTVQARIRRCSFIQTAATGAFIWVYNNSRLQFQSNFFYSALNSSQGCFYIYDTQSAIFVGGYILGHGVGSAIYSAGNTRVIVSDGLLCKNFINFIYPETGLELISDREGLTTTYEFNTITNLLGRLPKWGCKLGIPAIYGTLPTNLINSVTTGYVFVDPERDISISVPGIYGEYESQTSATLTNNTVTDIAVGDIGQNKSVKIEYQITRGTGVRFGTFQLFSDGTNLYTMPDEFGTDSDAEVSAEAIVLSGLLDGTEINLRATLNSTGSNGTMKYSITRIMN